MKFLTLFSLVFIVSSPAFAACEGYNNAMDALESAIQQSDQKQKTTRTYSATPPMDSINAAIDDLENAIEKHRIQNSIDPARPYPHNQKSSF